MLPKDSSTNSLIPDEFRDGKVQNGICLLPIDKITTMICFATIYSLFLIASLAISFPEPTCHLVSTKTLFIVSNASKNRSEFVLIMFYLQLINSGHADCSMADKKHGKLSS